ncbi:MAG TPA: group II intron maturase-specific domain-containing protein [Verrucomicrobiota bacterium]|nr:group II intron maturase-specific domain-containing protein [Verrucomicrobiota bacterium]HOA62903.1 group II intron maturase-specific domain-containing protein [Verrucomicrobiota bacterium]HOF49890.1 group II intron maturase-specific domain-containing protein [Verrucomicrobiota bacterium]HOG88664.1 group II intron maturase-specific domain-containing protein [Verrucomicrobiota bacterium]HOU89258.1 group II intron maturase-specific domain-containing protein [Verrucomicrobiota bacterium]
MAYKSNAKGPPDAPAPGRDSPPPRPWGWRQRQSRGAGSGRLRGGFLCSERQKQKFQDKVRALTVRSHNLDAAVIEKLNQVIRGTAHYFATRWFTGRHVFRKLDSWIRRRVRCMKFKRFGYHDNRRWPVKQAEQLGLLRLQSFCWS